MYLLNQQDGLKIQLPDIIADAESKRDSEQPVDDLLVNLKSALERVKMSSLPNSAKELTVSQTDEKSQQVSKLRRKVLHHLPNASSPNSLKLLKSLKSRQSQQSVGRQQSSLQSSESLRPRAPASVRSLRSPNESKYQVNSLIQLPQFKASDPMCTRCLSATDREFYDLCGGKR